MDERELEDIYGPAAPYSEHQRGQHIRYRDVLGEEQSGVILWVCAAATVAGNKTLPLQYIVMRDGAGDSFPDAVAPGDVLVEGNEG